MNSGLGFATNLLCHLKQVAFPLSASGVYTNNLEQGAVTSILILGRLVVRIN